jgi:protein transport protein SEC13
METIFVLSKEIFSIYWITSCRTVRVFEVRKGEQSLVASLREHEGPVWQVAWAHPMYGRLLASCGYDRKLIIWQEDQSSWRSIYTYTEHTSSSELC